jgi:hypothetical protein
MTEPVKRLEELRERVDQFRALQLPGQPMMMHMGTKYLVNDLMTALEEASALRAQEGMVMVPREPTEEMLDAGWQFVTVGLTNGSPRSLADLYQAMISASPLASQEG